MDGEEGVVVAVSELDGEEGVVVAVSYNVYVRERVCVVVVVVVGGWVV